jgi:hypothetical protein
MLPEEAVRDCVNVVVHETWCRERERERERERRERERCWMDGWMEGPNMIGSGIMSVHVAEPAAVQWHDSWPD